MNCSNNVSTINSSRVRPAIVWQPRRNDKTPGNRVSQLYRSGRNQLQRVTFLKPDNLTFTPTARQDPASCAEGQRYAGFEHLSLVLPYHWLHKIFFITWDCLKMCRYASYLNDVVPPPSLAFHSTFTWWKTITPWKWALASRNIERNNLHKSTSSAPSDWSTHFSR